MKTFTHWKTSNDLKNIYVNEVNVVNEININAYLCVCVCGCVVFEFLQRKMNTLRNVLRTSVLRDINIPQLVSYIFLASRKSDVT